jgi:hypothetical protein
MVTNCGACVSSLSRCSPKNTYKVGTGTALCVACQTFSFTVKTGAKSQSDCLCVSLLVAHLKFMRCWPQSQGRYRCSGCYPVTCTLCPTNTTTLGPGGALSLDCSCVPGYTCVLFCSMIPPPHFWLCSPCVNGASVVDQTVMYCVVSCFFFGC